MDRGSWQAIVHGVARVKFDLVIKPPHGSLRGWHLYVEYIMRNAGLEEEQAGIQIARRNISNLRYADDTTLMAESEEELKSLLMKVKEERGKSWLKAQHSEN